MGERGRYLNAQAFSLVKNLAKNLERKDLRTKFRRHTLGKKCFSSFIQTDFMKNEKKLFGADCIL